MKKLLKIILLPFTLIKSLLIRFFNLFKRKKKSCFENDFENAKKIVEIASKNEDYFEIIFNYDGEFIATWKNVEKKAKKEKKKNEATTKKSSTTKKGTKEA